MTEAFKKAAGGRSTTGRRKRRALISVSLSSNGSS
uniref:Uncharacterized protein n=1 Tax=Musa acuminata subsp. malaccensis TaxID=214687 RepID=A0A804I9K4_MUSAM